ncbi:hypothetical protein C8R46DRAFT_1065762 [Mycena filopes]|nr:hypothetical protein C8R46DRAFT_1065762 [Mycena filopes]
MHTIRTVFKTLTLLVTIVAVAGADDDSLTTAGVDSLNCFVAAGPGVKTMFTNANKECKCDVATTGAQGGWSKCPSPSDPSHGFAICTPGAGCTQECFHNAPVNTQGECTPFPVAEEPGMTTMTDEICTNPGQVIGAYTGAGCQCDAPNWHETRGGQVCNKNVPENAIGTCLRSTAEVGDSYCSFQCKPGFEKKDDLCVAKTTTEDPSKEPSDPEDTKNDQPTASDLAPGCPDPFIISFASPTGNCGCVASVAMAKKRKADAILCLPPSTNGKVGCKDVGTASQCSVHCDSGYMPSTDEKECVKGQVEAESVTLAGTATPRDSFETSCTQKVFKLPGQLGCQCAMATPDGGQECSGAGENEYVICRYKKGSGKVAVCSKNCVQGTYPDEENKCN